MLTSMLSYKNSTATLYNYPLQLPIYLHKKKNQPHTYCNICFTLMLKHGEFICKVYAQGVHVASFQLLAKLFQSST